MPVEIVQVDIPDSVKPGDWLYVKVLLNSDISQDVTLEVDAYLDGRQIIPTQEWTLTASPGQNWYTSPFAIIPPSEGTLKVCVWQRYPAYQPDIQVCDTATVGVVALTITREDLYYEGYPTPPYVNETRYVHYAVELNRAANLISARLEVNGEIVESDSKTNSNYIHITHPITFTAETNICGYVSANGLTSSKCITVTPVVPKADIRVYDIKASKTNPSPGETITITAYVHNFGDGAGTATIDLYINGKPQNLTKTVTLNPDEGTTLEWQISFDKGGTYNVCAGKGGENMPCVTITVEAPEEVTPVAPPTKPTYPSWLPYAVIAAAGIAAAYVLTKK